ncbi:MAG TPA: acyl-CoA dehydrogenase family protein [Acidimicrobiales bacterium]|nr:acyl-CoA dehydrogenase family protein [Acidimicrobiales bacterium]
MTITEAELESRTKELLSEFHPDEVDQFTFRGQQFDRGLAMVHFPEGLGGLDVAPKLQGVVDATIQANAKTWYENMAINPMGIGMAAPTLLTYAAGDWKRRLMRPLYTGEELWCQMFSEPGAGSDVAGLSMRAERDGDEWIINGQKVWTSLAHHAKWGLLLTRSDPEVPKHNGMTYFLVDMGSPGVEIRPLHQITGDAEFNEVFFTDVRIPDSQRLGEPGDGWRVAITTLMNERTSLGSGSARKDVGPIHDLVKLWKARDPERFSALQTASLRDEITRVWIRAELHRLTSARAKANRKTGNPGPEFSVGKLAQAELNQDIHEIATRVMGADSLLFEPGFARKRRGDMGDWNLDTRVKRAWLRSQANTIEGGTSDIMRNILGERVLGLPGEPRGDKDVPWSDIPRN